MKKYAQTIKGFCAGLLTAVLICGMALSADAASLLKKIEVAIGGIQIYIDGELKKPADANGNVVEAMIYNGTTYLPVRALTGMLTDKEVSWDGDTQSVYIGKKPETKSYRQVVQELVNRYGVADAEKLNKFRDISEANIPGVYAVKQLDLNGDGADELFVLWKPNVNEMPYPDESVLSAAIYTMEGNKAVRKWYDAEALYESGVANVSIHMLGETPVIYFSSTRYGVGPLICYHDGRYKDLSAITFTPAEEAKIAEGAKDGMRGESDARQEVMLARVELTFKYNPLFRYGGEGILGTREADVKSLHEALSKIGVA